MKDYKLKLEMETDFDEVHIELEKLILKVERLEKALKKANKEMDLLASKELN